ncbi:transglutaminase domain-containing protein [Acetanaerobacterium elongatum]|uniref:Transglutaminase-like superfamily protein n=1 Tax=Acetanaerobacterium elongatum TaxID=258515 RepID=A0A1G9UQG4_9FIRM|nr:transglutaminase-like domain-containing protein [Acetanaerobacterium elongatum]SDM62103.1 Transglutaminase-like superfamily protein [Acetanaerobacterium elongatum]
MRAIPAKEPVPSSPAQEDKPQQPDLSHCRVIQNYYVCSVIDKTLKKLITEEMDDYEKLLTVYRHLVCEVSFFNEPLGTDLWRYRGDPKNIPSVYEARTLSPLLYGIGSCEDYASAFVTLCDRMGFEARYVPGLTYSIEGKLVPHAWAMVRLDGSWYHADPQLEDNIIKADRVLKYRYFLKGDKEMSAHHRWGTLVEQPSEYALALPQCPESYKATPPEVVVQAPRPNRERIAKQINSEKTVYAQNHAPLGELPQLTLPE